jgi:Protein of unknown function (DUF3237)
MFCQQVRAKNTSRQRQHLQECPNYLAAMKDSIPANNLLHKFDEGEIARSLQLPTPSLELDFRISIKLNPRVSLGPGLFGERNWVSFVGGSWAGRWGKGIVTVSCTAEKRWQTRNLPFFSLVDKIRNWSSKIKPLAYPPITFFRLMTSLLPSSESQPLAGGQVPKTSWISFKILLRPMVSVQIHTNFDSTWSWRPGMKDISL